MDSPLALCFLVLLHFSLYSFPSPLRVLFYPMIDLNQIQAFSQQIVEKFQPERIILFGSYAQGQPTEDSDVDLLVILPFQEMPVQKAISIRQQLRPPFPLDLLARTPEQIQHRLEMGDFFIQDILQNGRVLYEATHKANP